MTKDVSLEGKNAADSHFDRFAESYRDVLDRNVRISGESSQYFAEYKSRYVARQLGVDFFGNVVDFGCGVGLLSLALKGALPLAAINGYDVSEACIRRIDQGLLAQGLFTSDLERLGRAFHAAIISNVLHHIPIVRREGTVSDLYNRLLPGGYLLIFEHNPTNPATRWAVAHCPFDEDAVLLTPAEAESYMVRAGLKVLRRDYITFFPRFLACLRPLEPWLAWLPMGAQYAIVAEKRA